MKELARTDSLDNFINKSNNYYEGLTEEGNVNKDKLTIKGVYLQDFSNIEEGFYCNKTLTVYCNGTTKGQLSVGVKVLDILTFENREEGLKWLTEEVNKD